MAIVRAVNIECTAIKPNIVLEIVVDKDHLVRAVGNIHQRRAFIFLVQLFKIVKLLICIKPLVKEIHRCLSVRVACTECQVLMLLFIEHVL